MAVRLYLDQPLGPGQSLEPSPANAHYLFSVMRLGAGAELLVFNGRDGEWRARVARADRRGGKLEAVERVRGQEAPPDLWLLFAPVRKARTDFVVEKAVELGARSIRPVLTEFTNAARVRRDRLEARAVEAAEQCGATWIPEVAEPAGLDACLGAWPGGRRLLFCDEAGEAGPGGVLDAPAPAAVLVGPEGGFSERERAMLLAHPAARPVGLGPRILRAETAAVAALALWQAAAGDWRRGTGTGGGAPPR